MRKQLSQWRTQVKSVAVWRYNFLYPHSAGYGVSMTEHFLQMGPCFVYSIGRPFPSASSDSERSRVALCSIVKMGILWLCSLFRNIARPQIERFYFVDASYPSSSLWSATKTCHLFSSELVYFLLFRSSKVENTINCCRSKGGGYKLWVCPLRVSKCCS